MDVIETVEKHCLHDDCVYRSTLLSYQIDYCDYITLEGKPRGCPISQCCRYKPGKRKVVMTTRGLWLDWLIDEEKHDSEIY